MATEMPAGRMQQVLDQLTREQVLTRLFARDHTLWSESPREIVDRLGWLDCPVKMSAAVPDLQALAAEVRSEGIRDIVVLGMGGSSLAAEVLQKLCGNAPDYPAVQIIDTTDPLTIVERGRQLSPPHTVFVAATKSGGTVETFSLLKHFFRWSRDALGEAGAARRFIAITDAGSGLETLALQLGFRKVFLNDPEIGGRYAALSFFGLVPAALAGIDVRSLLDRATEVMNTPTLELAAFLGSEALAGRNKLTLLADEELRPFGAWLEQLVAESSGKDGKGIVPVINSPWHTPWEYGPDCCFVALQTAADSPAAQQGAKLTAAGRTVFPVSFAGSAELGAQFYAWELATALACHVLGVQPFDQPDVELAKVMARQFLTEYAETGVIAEPQYTVSADGVSLVGPHLAGGSLEQALRGQLAHVSGGGYICLQAFLPVLPAVEQRLAELAAALRAVSGVPVTVGFGPRYLHSTGQLHKGGPAGGLYIQLTCADKLDLAIPDDALAGDSALTFGTLKRAQAQGDYQALVAAGRNVVCCHLSEYLLGLARLISAVRTLH